jgi:hypothetical protein
MTYPEITLRGIQNLCSYAKGWVFRVLETVNALAVMRDIRAFNGRESHNYRLLRR